MAKMKPENDSVKTETQNNGQDLQSILERLDKQEAQIKEQNELISKLKDWDNNIKEEAYKWPRHYSFKTFDGKPVLSYKSFKKDNTRDWKYKTIQWQEIINQWLKLTLWDFDKEKEIEMEVAFDNFQEWFQWWVKQSAEIIRTQDDEVIWYKFKTLEYWIFTVSINSIN